MAEYEKEPIWSDSDDCKRIRQAETRALKNKNKGKPKSTAFKPSSTLRNPRIGQQFRNAEFKHDNSPTSSDNRQYPFQYRPNLYPQHPNSRQSWKPWRETETADYCFTCGENGIGDGHAQKKNIRTTEDKIKGNYEGEQKTGEYE